MKFVPKQLERMEAEFSIPKATVIIAVLTLLSRISGLIRTQLLAITFGAGEISDLYLVAFRIPDFLMSILILGTLTIAFLPVFTEYLVKNRAEGYAFASTVLTIAFTGMVAICIGLLLFLKPLTEWLAPGFSPEQIQETIGLTRLILIAQIIFALSNLYTAVLNAKKRFIIAGIAPVLYNVGIIVGVVFFYPHFGTNGLGYGVILGALLHLLVQYIEAKRLGFSWKPKLELSHPGLRRLLKLYIPRMLFVDLSQISLIIASVLGSMLAAGSISVFNWAFDLQAVATGIFGISTAIAAFPVLAENYAMGEHRRFWDVLCKSATQILFFILPISVGILIFRAYIVRILFGAGEFNWEDTIGTFQVLGIFSFSLFAQALLPLFSRALYARHNTRTPMFVGLCCIVVNIFFSYLLTPRFGIQGVAYGFTIANILNIAILYFILRNVLSKDTEDNRKYLRNFDVDIITNFIKIILSSLVFGAVSFIALRLFAPFVDTHTRIGITIQAGLSATLGGLAFLATAYLLKIEESSRFLNQLKSLYRRVF